MIDPFVSPTDEELAVADHAFRSDLYAGQVALVTGGAGGIGRSICLLLGRLGARLVVCGRNEQKLPDLVESLARHGNALEVASHRANIRLIDTPEGQITSVLGVVGESYQVCQNRELAEFTDALAQTGEVVIVADGPINLNSTEVEGIDLVTRYMTETATGTWTFLLSASRLLDFTERSTLSSGAVQVVEKVGTAASREAYPKWRGIFTTQWGMGPWAANYKARYIGDTTEIANSAPRHIGSVFYHDLAGSYSFREGMQLKVGIDNVLDKQPPSSLTNTNINYDINTYDAVGRFMYAQFSWSFGL